MKQSETATTTATPSDAPAMTDDAFDAAYARPEPAYGFQPSAELAALLKQSRPEGEALDLGAGAGRNTLAMAAAGLRITAVDTSTRGLERLQQLAADAGLADKVETVAEDVRRFSIHAGQYHLIAAITILDHLSMVDALELWQAMVAGLAADGILCVEVHLTDDPGSPTGAGPHRDTPVSETAGQVINYFAPGELLRLAIQSADLRIVRYEERLEWDYTHGPEHQHTKATLVAVKGDRLLEWYGQPELFPRRPDASSGGSAV